MQYRAIRDCFFFDRYWNKGETYDFPEGLEMPHHFEFPDGRPAHVEEIVPEPLTMSQMAQAARAAQPKTGMAYVPNEQPVDPILEPKRKPGRPPKQK